MAMENYGEFKHDHVSLYLICVTLHYSPGVVEWGNKEWLAVVLSPNLGRGLKLNFVAKSGILGFLILFGRFLYEEKY